MKSKQLANVLIKILGLSVCLYTIPSCVGGVIIAMMQLPTSSGGFEVTRVVSYAVGAGVEFAMGIVIISMSRKIAGLMFKDDE